MSALSDWSAALWEQLFNVCSNEEAREIIEENAKRLMVEAEVKRDEWWKSHGHSEDC